ncbi:hypothetical protein XA68_10840 [Ophiocordyceps unilateralis]|uniref:Uncharacterized protein n=1 Tax=Ophiocordyceps unilateralis TaxID=268505 RepID=A0A2A9P2E9_OPHUN|nr:hypothetical protein XA68_10840 [Ophiocordyceps unilateralis]
MAFPRRRPLFGRLGVPYRPVGWKVEAKKATSKDKQTTVWPTTRCLRSVQLWVQAATMYISRSGARPTLDRHVVSFLFSRPVLSLPPPPLPFF